MKCSECARRNHDDNQFCIYCGTTLKTETRRQSGERSGCSAMLPPQDIDELIGDRYSCHQQSSRQIHPAVPMILAIAVGLSGAYYWFFYRDVYQILAIDYQTTQLVNE
ncbi:MAG: hypothetical protein V1807_01930 [Patescibacteria group bacterium]